MTSHLDSQSAEQRAVEKFYTRIRQQIDDIEPPSKNPNKPIATKLAHLKEERRYGVIKRTELELLLLNYDENSDKPTTCARLATGNFAKLLWSKPGFHHPASTDYLVEDLNIKEKDRDSFLGGHSNYSVPEDKSLNAILKHHSKMYVKNRSKELLDIMDSDDISNTFHDDVKEFVGLEPDDPNTLAVKGRYQMKMKRYDPAIMDLKSALDRNCDHQEQIRLNLAEAYFRVGHDLYSRHVFDIASEMFHQSLWYDSQHQGSRLHAELCVRKIQERNHRFGDHRNSSWSRRR